MKKLLMAVAAVAAFGAFGETYYVDGSVETSGDGSLEAPFKHPQMAILAADGVEETEIIVNDGTYAVFTDADWVAAGVDPAPSYSNRVMYVNKSNLYIHSANGREAVTLDGGYIANNVAAKYNSHAIEVVEKLTDVRVSGFSVTRGFHTMGTGTEIGRASSVGAASGLLDNLAIHGYQISGNAMVNLAGTAVLSNSTFDAKTRVAYNTNRGKPACIYMSGSAQLVDCRISDITPFTSYMNNPPTFEAVYVTSANNLIRNCLISGNTNGKDANQNAVGGGLYVGAAATIESCTITDNTVWGYGGGVYISGSPTFRNCLITGNKHLGTTGSGDDIYIASGTPVFDHCCAGDGLKAGENGNLSTDPQFDDSFVPSEMSLVAGAGVPQDWMAGAKDLAGNPRLWEDGTVTMGAFETQGRNSSVVVDFAVVGGVGSGRAPFEVAFSSTVSVDDPDTVYTWNFGVGEPLEGKGLKAVTNVYTQAGGFDVSLSVAVPGRDEVTVTKPGLVVAVGEICYVKEGSDGIPPYDTWEKATSNIEAAVALNPRKVLATNGTYSITLQSGLVLQTDIEVTSVEGPAVTRLDTGINAVEEGLGNVVRSFANLSHPSAVLRGFTLRRGRGRALTATAGTLDRLWLRTYRGIYRNQAVEVSNATVMDCDFDFTGGPITDQSYDHPIATSFGGTSLVERCVFRNAKWDYSTWKESKNGNAAAVELRGSAQMRSSLVCSNTFICGFGQLRGGGVYMSGSAVLDNCTLVGNSVKTNVVMTGENYGCKGGGVYCASETCKVRNCIQWGNMVDGQPAPGDMTEDPLFAEEPPYSLQKGSPCINKGVKLEWMTADSRDLYGNPRKVSHPDLGCCESDVRPGLLLLVR